MHGPHMRSTRPHFREQARSSILSGHQGGYEMIDEATLTEKTKSDLLYLEQLNAYAENTKNTPEYIRAMAMYTHALHVIDQRYGELQHDRE